MPRNCTTRARTSSWPGGVRQAWRTRRVREGGSPLPPRAGLRSPPRRGRTQPPGVPRRRRPHRASHQGSAASAVACGRRPGAARAVPDAGHFPPRLDTFHIAWQCAAWSHAGQPVAEAQAKRRLLRWRLHELLAVLTGELTHYQEAARAWSDNSVTQARLGCTLGHARQPAAAAEHLHRAVIGDPFDVQAARALYQALEECGDLAGARRLARERRLLAHVAPQLVPPERWFLDAAPVGDEPASLIVLCAARWNTHGCAWRASWNTLDLPTNSSSSITARPTERQPICKKSAPAPVPSALRSCATRPTSAPPPAGTKRSRRSRAVTSSSCTTTP